MRFFLFFLLSLAGVADTLYLIIKHRQTLPAGRQAKPLICPFHHDCSKVTESKWGTVFYFRNETLGLVYYLVMLGLGAAVFLTNAEIFGIFIFWGAAAAFLLHIFFASLQIFVIKDYCFYCLISALISLLMFITVLA